jgi:hypothetical protein
MPGLSWKPQLHGEIYCSPACGGRCTKAAHDAAQEQAAALATRLGPGWTARVWENLGWHFSAISSCKRIEVYPSCSNQAPHQVLSYHALLGEPTRGGGVGGIWTGSGETPELAVSTAVKAAKEKVAWFQAIIEGL